MSGLIERIKVLCGQPVCVKRIAITQGQLHERVVWAIQQIVRTRPLAICEWELVDRRNEAMTLFITNNPYFLTRKDMGRAKKLIAKHNQWFMQGKVT